MWMTMLWWDYSNETSSVVLSHGAIYLVRSSQLFEALEEILWCDHWSKTSAFGNTFTWPVFEHFSLKKRGIWTFSWKVKIRSLAWTVTLGFLACDWETGTLLATVPGQFYCSSVLMYRSNRSFNMPPPGNPPGIWLFWKLLFKFPLPGPKCRSNAPH